MIHFHFLQIATVITHQFAHAGHHSRAKHDREPPDPADWETLASWQHTKHRDVRLVACPGLLHVLLLPKAAAAVGLWVPHTPAKLIKKCQKVMVTV